MNECASNYVLNALLLNKTLATVTKCDYCDSCYLPEEWRNSWTKV